jgi:hypothetical protein
MQWMSLQSVSLRSCWRGCPWRFLLEVLGGEQQTEHSKNPSLDLLKCWKLG